MKIVKLIIISLAILIGINEIKAQVVNSVSSLNDDSDAPEIFFEKKVHDYGDIKKGSDGTCEFIFINTGKEPLILSNVQSSCGCTVPTWPKEPVLAGKSAVIKVVYDTKRIGIISKTITVTSNAKTSPIVLSIKGVIRDKY